MKITLNTYQIADELKKDTNARWSYNGSLALAEYLDQYDSDNGEDTELDLCSIRCDFSEHSSLIEWAREHFGATGSVSEFSIESSEDEEDIDPEGTEAKIKEYIQDHGKLIEFEGGIIVSSF